MWSVPIKASQNVSAREVPRDNGPRKPSGLHRSLQDLRNVLETAEQAVSQERIASQRVPRPQAMRLSLEVEEEYERLRVQREEASQWAMARETTAPAAGGTAPRVLRTELTPSPPPASDAWMECVTDMRAEALNQGSICPYGSTPTASDPAGGLYVYHPDLGPVRQEMLVTPPRDRDRDRAGNGDGEWDGAKSPVDTDLYMNHYNSYLHTGNSRSSEGRTCLHRCLSRCTRLCPASLLVPSPLALAAAASCPLPLSLPALAVARALSRLCRYRYPACVLVPGWQLSLMRSHGQ